MPDAYDRFAELMQYFYFQHNVAVLLVTIVAFNTLKGVGAILGNRCCIKSVSGFDLIIRFISGVALANALLFQGVLADISPAESGKWLTPTFALCMVAFGLFVMQMGILLWLRKKLRDASP